MIRSKSSMIRSNGSPASGACAGSARAIVARPHVGQDAIALGVLEVVVDPAADSRKVGFATRPSVPRGEVLAPTGRRRPRHEIPHVSEHRRDRQRGRLRPVDHRDRMVGRKDRRRCRRDAARSASISASRCSTPPIPTATAAAKSSWPKRSATAASASSTRRSSATTSTRGRRDAKARSRSAARFLAGLRPQRARGVAAPPPDRLRRHLPDAQRPDGADRRRRAVGAARSRSSAKARFACTASRSGPPSAGSTKASMRCRNATSPTLQIIWNMLEQYPGNEQIRAAYDAQRRHRLHDPRAAFERNARRTLHRRYGLPRRTIIAVTARARG